MANKNNKNSKQINWITKDIINNDPYFLEFKKLLPEFNFEDLNDPFVKKENIKLLKAKSSIMEQIIDDKGGWLMPEKMYVGDPNYITKAKEYDPKLERFLFNNSSARSLYTRFRFLVDEIYPQLIEEILQKKGKVKIASFGSGTGLDVMLAIENFENGVKADMYDIDPLAIKIGRERAILKGLEGRISYHRENIRTIKKRNYYDIGILIGVICPLRDSLATLTMSSLKKNISKNGLLIVSSSSDKMKEDIFGRFFREYSSGWDLQYRDNKRMKKLAEKSGYEPLVITSEPMNFHKILIAKK